MKSSIRSLFVVAAIATSGAVGVYSGRASERPKSVVAKQTALRPQVSGKLSEPQPRTSQPYDGVSQPVNGCSADSADTCAAGASVASQQTIANPYLDASRAEALKAVVGEAALASPEALSAYRANQFKTYAELAKTSVDGAGDGSENRELGESSERHEPANSSEPANMANPYSELKQAAIGIPVPSKEELAQHHAEQFQNYTAQASSSAK